jgi:hypothetical protein
MHIPDESDRAGREAYICAIPRASRDTLQRRHYAAARPHPTPTRGSALADARARPRHAGTAYGLTRLHAYFEVARDARDVLYIAGPRWSETACVITNDGSICPS